MSNQNVIAVLGMHRSGTSFLTGTLQQAGLFLGKHHQWNPHNLKGNRENPDIQVFHDWLLQQNGGAWDNPPHFVAWSSEAIERAKQIIQDYEAIPIWGFKDPRTLLVFDGWKELVPNLKLIGIVRHPIAVAASLHARSGMSYEEGVKLWCSYNEHLLSLLQQYRFPMLSFDWDEAVLHELLLKLLPELGLGTLPQEDRFYSDELKHNAPNSLGVRISERAASLYEKLITFAELTLSLRDK